MAVNREKARGAAERGVATGAVAFVVWAVGSALLSGQRPLAQVLVPALMFGLTFGLAYGVMQYRRA
jgi:hypothetical protein